MPRIIINEVDSTAAGALSNVAGTIVYVPAILGSGKTFGPVLYTNAAELEAKLTAIGYYPLVISSGETPGDVEAKGVTVALQLLRLGMFVLFEGVEEEGALASATLWDKLKDKYKYKFRFLTSAGYTNANANMINVATARKDCVALIDHAELITPSEGQSYAQAVYNIISTFPSKYAAAFSPWCKFNINNDTYVLPGSFSYLAAFALMSQSNPTYVAAAGSTRGVIPGLIEPLYEYGQIDSDILQARSDIASQDNVGVAINPIMKVDPYGYIVWGNRTLNNNNGLVASSFLNIRNLVVDIAKRLFDASNKYEFEQNTDILWINFKAQIVPMLESIRTNFGLAEYSISREAAASRGVLRARVNIVPIEAVEDFDLFIELNDSLETTVTEA